MTIDMFNLNITITLCLFLTIEHKQYFMFGKKIEPTDRQTAERQADARQQDRHRHANK